MTRRDRPIAADQVNLLVQEGEGLTVEFKERYTPHIDQDIVAFANAKGGTMGIQKTRTAMRAAGLHEPVFESTEPEGFFRAVLHRSPEYALKKGVPGSKKRVGEKVGEKLTENQQRIIEFIRAAPSISARELSTKVGISAREVVQ